MNKMLLMAFLFRAAFRQWIRDFYQGEQTGKVKEFTLRGRRVDPSTPFRFTIGGKRSRPVTSPQAGDHALD